MRFWPILAASLNNLATMHSAVGLREEVLASTRPEPQGCTPRHTRVSKFATHSVQRYLLAAGPVSLIRRTALQTDILLEISRCRVSMMSPSVVMAGFASHGRHNCGCGLIENGDGG